MKGVVAYSGSSHCLPLMLLGCCDGMNKGCGDDEVDECNPGFCSSSRYYGDLTTERPLVEGHCPHPNLRRQWGKWSDRVIRLSVSHRRYWLWTAARFKGIQGTASHRRHVANVGQVLEEGNPTILKRYHEMKESRALPAPKEPPKIVAQPLDEETECVYVVAHQQTANFGESFWTEVTYLLTQMKSSATSSDYCWTMCDGSCEGLYGVCRDCAWEPVHDQNKPKEQDESIDIPA
ncbi:hypothetical protein K474DRAFT_1680699 [Panus rudis PR-1116 ss-1]|nr:hypothetical protein K474DRAFT_1680699 [Panus rudis PR-1116 ss-1]